MIYINKNSSNDIILTLSELTTLTNSYYLFNFKSHSSNADLYFVAADISTGKTRYNEFIIYETASTNTNLTAGTINISSGWFSYEVFEQTSPTNLNPTNLNKVEFGLGFVNGSEQQQYIKETTGQNFFDYVSG